MKCSITARHFEASDDLKTYIEDHLEEIEKFLDKIIGANVVLTVEKYRNRAEIIVETGIRNFVSEAITDDMYRSVDECLGKLKTQTRRHKEKLKHHKFEKTEPVPSESPED
jgi:putative sigma-54 modulation protein